MPAKKTPQTQAPTQRKTTAIKDKLTKTQILNEIAQHTDLSRKQVAAVFDELGILIERSIKKRALGEFTLPGLLKIVTVKKPARKAYKGINPLTGEEHMFKARPASTAVKVRPLKKLKDFAAS
jgi:nucleoid DNA-binding protein